MANEVTATVADEKPTCGIVMPISPTPQHGPEHWQSVLELVQRAIFTAGMTPQTVWTGSTEDRITSRILRNLFEVPILICDITDSNANVMLELGMRLTSKKPTVVIFEDGGPIPFDIGDFEALPYPKHLTILDMERFLARLAGQLNEKFQAYETGTYRSFMSDIETFEVLEASAREVPFNRLVTDQLDAILGRIDQLEFRSLKLAEAPRPSTLAVALSQPIRPSNVRVRQFLIPAKAELIVRDMIRAHFADEAEVKFPLRVDKNKTILSLTYVSTRPTEFAASKVVDFIVEQGGTEIGLGPRAPSTQGEGQ